jgi:hypothetical protein
MEKAGKTKKQNKHDNGIFRRAVMFRSGKGKDKKTVGAFGSCRHLKNIE